MIDINYQKRKNTELFKSLEKPDTHFLSKTQNFIPIYQRFFTLNDTNYNNVNLNHKYYISSVNKSNNENTNIYNCRIKNVNNTNKNKDKDVFFKMAPLLDPFKYLIGKYNTADPTFLNLPHINSDESVCHTKILDVNNSAYVDGLFVFLNSYLLHGHNFYHSLDYYGSFLGIKNNFVLNVFDDIDYLNNSDYFNKNKNVLFSIDDYDHLFQFKNDSLKLKPIKIQHDSTAKSNISINSLSNDVFENIFEDNNILPEKDSFETELVDMDMSNINIDNNNTTEPVNNLANETQNNVTLNSSSTCSSRTSYTLDGDENADADDDADDDDDDDDDCEHCNSDEADDDNTNNDDWEDTSDEEERLDVIIPKIPVQVICMESCENTFDDLILSNDITNEEWLSAFMQIIMILITYQKAFHFTHNDLHSNNIMYNTTDKKYIYYCYKKQYYKVPTFGRIFKIIDFGRSIYKFNGKLFCSDSFQSGNDAATQYNTEPYFNEKKPRLEPNFSFDLCRLACSIYDYVIEEVDDIKNLETCDPVKRLVFEWCLDDKGINMLYKNNGTDRYPDFKLYKMISRCVHKHTPNAQLDRPEFKSFSNFKGEVPNDVIDIDKIPVYTN